MQKRMSKGGAVELSISTIVIVVLAVSMLILGLVLVRTIFKTATNVATMSDDALKNQMAKLYGEDSRLVVYPDTKEVSVSIKDGSGKFGFAMLNNEQGSSKNMKFSYTITAVESTVKKNCNGATVQEMMDKITTPTSDKDITIASGDKSEQIVRFKVATGDPLCLVRYRIDVTVNGEPYSSEQMDVSFTA